MAGHRLEDGTGFDDGAICRSCVPTCILVERSFTLSCAVELLGGGLVLTSNIWHKVCRSVFGLAPPSTMNTAVR